MGRLLIGIGLLLVVLGALWPWLSRLPFGRLPGDIHIHRNGMDVYFPLATSIVISILISLILWLWRR